MRCDALSNPPSLLRFRCRHKMLENIALNPTSVLHSFSVKKMKSYRQNKFVQSQCVCTINGLAVCGCWCLVRTWICIRSVSLNAVPATSGVHFCYLVHPFAWHFAWTISAKYIPDLSTFVYVFVCATWQQKLLIYNLSRISIEHFHNVTQIPFSFLREKQKPEMTTSYSNGNILLKL